MTFPFKDALGYELHVPLIIELLAIASEECFVFWLVLLFREIKNNFIQLSKHISLYCIYRFSATHEIIFFSQLFQPARYSHKIYILIKKSVTFKTSMNYIKMCILN